MNDEKLHDIWTATLDGTAYQYTDDDIFYATIRFILDSCNAKVLYKNDNYTYRQHIYMVGKCLDQYNFKKLVYVDIDSSFVEIEDKLAYSVINNEDIFIKAGEKFTILYLKYCSSYNMEVITTNKTTTVKR